jgi:fucose 4-O-acetylase-like acetyltransferase
VWHFSEKWTVGPLRLFLFLVWFTALFMVVEKYSKTINRFSRNIFMMLGQNSLFVYVAHAFIVFIFKLFIYPGHPLLYNFEVTAGALLSLVIITRLYVAIKPAKKPLPAPKTKTGSSQHGQASRLQPDLVES